MTCTASADDGYTSNGTMASSVALPALAPQDHAAVENFRSFLRMRTVHPDPCAGYEQAGVLFKRYADELGLGFERLDLAPGHPIYILKWTGTEPKLPSLVLNSHMDVVPVDMEKWTKAPWDAELVEGKIYGRGTQDMKCVSIQYIEAVGRLKKSGYAPRRTILLLYVPDEEVGGNKGMKLLVAHAKAAELNMGLVLDEGLANPAGKYR
jgi:aminoacylase